MRFGKFNEMCTVDKGFNFIKKLINMCGWLKVNKVEY